MKRFDVKRLASKVNVEVVFAELSSGKGWYFRNDVNDSFSWIGKDNTTALSILKIIGLQKGICINE